jgi:hypothetical protein
LSVTLQHVRPVVRRRLEVPSAMTLGGLSVVLLTAFDWEGGHLHQFEVGEVVYGPDGLVDDAFMGAFARRSTRHEDAATLGRVLPRPGDAAVWTYDLGDDWRHRIEVTAVQPADPDVVYPRCTGGAGLAPEEDTGRQRRGTFGPAQQAELNAVLEHVLGERGRDLRGGEPVPDGALAWLFPELDATRAGGGCDCEECAGGEDDRADGVPPLPVLRALPDGELAAAAAATPLVRRAVTLAGWLGAGRALTSSKVLRPAEAGEAVALLELDRPVLPPHDGVDPLPSGGSARAGGARRRSAKDDPALHTIWRAALAAGLIEIRGRKACPGPELAVWAEPAQPAEPARPAEPAEPGPRLASWERLLAGYLETAAEAERADLSWHAGQRQALLPVSVMMLYTAAEAPLWPGILGLGDLLLNVGEDGEDGEDVDPLALLNLPEGAARWAGVLERWAVAGVVAATDSQDVDDVGPAGEEFGQVVAELRKVLGVTGRGRPAMEHLVAPVFQALRRGPFVEVTPFGRYCLARVLRGHGLSVPTLGDLVDVPPDELLLALHDRDPADVAEEARGWLDARGDAWEAAVRDVVRSAAVPEDPGPARRSVLPAVIGVVAETKGAGPLLEEWQAHPMLAAPVAVGRFAVGQGPRPTAEQALWIAVDALSMAVDDEESFAELADLLEVGSLLAAPGGVGVAQRLRHPRARDVLRVLVRHLDDETLAVRLRRALKGRLR